MENYTKVDSIKHDKFCPVIDSIMTINASACIINQDFFHEMDDELKQHFQKIQRSIDKIYAHVEQHQTIRKF